MITFFIQQMNHLNFLKRFIRQTAQFTKQTVSRIKFLKSTRGSISTDKHSPFFNFGQTCDCYYVNNQFIIIRPDGGYPFLLVEKSDVQIQSELF